ncbi:hypothetical protein JXM83_01450 [Candidatus Woesearchaeota archaeon]|nr:hypothetical protein [Candidatus Woesearchaeota archaeon]
MKLKYKLALIVSIISILTILFSTHFLYLETKNDYLELEKRDTLHQLEQVNGTIKNLIEVISTKSLDWSYWDNTYSFALDLNQEYIESNLNAETLTNLQINLMAFFDSKGNYLYSIFVDENNTFLNISNELQKEFQSDNLIFKTENTKGIIDFYNKPTIIAVQPILKTDGSGPSTGFILFGKILSKKDLGYLSETIKIPMDFVDFKLNSSTYVKPINENLIFGFIQFRDLYNTKDYIIKIESNREIIALSQKVIQNLVLTTIIILLITSITLTFTLNEYLLNNVVIKRLHSINEQIKSMQHKTYLNKRITVIGNDEIKDLSNRINKYLDSIEILNKNIQKKSSELSIANKQITQMLKDKDDFLIQVSHNLRTPLIPIKNLTEVLLKNKKICKKGKKDLEIIRRNANSLEYLTNDVLNLLSLDLNKNTIKFNNVKILDLLNENKQITYIECKNKNITAEINKEMMSKVISIIVNNSIKYKQPKLKSKINATIKKEKEKISIEISDNGIGIEKENITKIFNEFFKTEQYQGGETTGLGLTIAKKIITLHNGSIKAKSKGKNKGTTIKIEIPIKHSSSSI